MPKTAILVIVIAVVLIAVAAGFCVFLKLQSMEQRQTQNLPANNSQIATQPIEKAVPLAEQKGEVGEVKVKDETTKEEAPLVSAVMPPVITSTVGEIKEIKDDFLIIRGEGTNFADGKPRELKTTFTAQTITFSQNFTQYKGVEGLKILKVGRRILVEGEGNIRGKTEFNLKTVNILD